VAKTLNETHAAAAEVRHVPVAQLLTQGRELFRMHFDEVGNFGEPLFINEGIFLGLEEGNVLVTLGAFTMQQRLIGYATATCTPQPFADILVCKPQAIFVHPGYRRCGNGTRLMACMKHEADARGARMLWGAKPGSTLDLILQKGRYEVLETIYTERRPA
jgi:GNAT superfamily N-acetyltransferase